MFSDVFVDNCLATVISTAQSVVIMEDRKTYFAGPSLPVAALILFGLWMGFCMCFSPDSVPHAYLSYAGKLYHYMAFEAPTFKWTFCTVAAIVHVGESLIALHLTSRKGVTDPWTRFKWWISVLLFGMFSMRYLLKLKDQTD